jgi:hypothetical protein
MGAQGSGPIHAPVDTSSMNCFHFVCLKSQSDHREVIESIPQPKDYDFFLGKLKIFGCDSITSLWSDCNFKHT